MPQTRFLRAMSWRSRSGSIAAAPRFVGPEGGRGRAPSRNRRLQTEPLKLEEVAFLVGWDRRAVVLRAAPVHQVLLRDIGFAAWAIEALILALVDVPSRPLLLMKNPFARAVMFQFRRANEAVVGEIEGRAEIEKA